MRSLLFWFFVISGVLGIVVTGQQQGQVNQQQFQQPPPPVQNQGQFQQQQQQFQQPPPPVQNNQGQYQQPPAPPPVQQFQQPPPPQMQQNNQQQFQQPPPPVQNNQGQFQQPPPPQIQLNNQGQFQQPPPPQIQLNNQGQQQQFQQPPPPAQQQQFQQPPPPAQQQQFQQPPPPAQQQQFQQPPPPAQQQQFQQPPPPVQQQQFQQPPPPVQQGNQGQFQQPPPPTPQQNQPTTTLAPKKKKNKPHPPPLRKDPPSTPQNGDAIRYPSAVRFKPDMDPSSSFVMLTAVISSGSRDCYFHQPITNFMVNFDVIRGGDLDIGLSIIDPDGVEIVRKDPENNSEIKISVSSENRDRSYAICLDNRKASREEKIVGISMSLDIDYQNPSDEEKVIVEAIRSYHDADDFDREKYEDSIQNLHSIEDKIDTVAQKVRKIMVHFNRLKHTTNMDRLIMGQNQNRVQNWSLFQITLMIFIAFLQTMVIRSLFEGGRLNPFTMFGLKSAMGGQSAAQSSTTTYRA